MGNHCAEHIYDNQTLFTALSRQPRLPSRHIYPFQLKALLGSFSHTKPFTHFRLRLFWVKSLQHFPTAIFNNYEFN
jgi:hypothetical protein